MVYDDGSIIRFPHHSPPPFFSTAIVAALVNLSKALEETIEEVDAKLQIVGAHHLPAAMHRQLAHSSVDATDSGVLGYDWSDRAPARTVIPDHKLLDRDLLPPSNLPDDETSESIGSVSLVLVRFDNYAGVQLWGVVLRGAKRQVKGVSFIV